jgi:subtilisin family serine protease
MQIKKLVGASALLALAAMGMAQIDEKPNLSGAQVFPMQPQPYFGKAKWAPGVVVVTFKPGATARDHRRLAQDYGLSIDQSRQSPYFVRYTVRASMNGLFSVDEGALAETMKRDPRIRSAELDFAVTPDQSLPNDPMFGDLWGLHNTGQSSGTADADVDAPEAWNYAGTYPRTVIAVIDDGVDWQHQDLLANIWTNPNEVAGNNIDDDNNGKVDDVRGWDMVSNDNDPTPTSGNEHGTHCAGTVGAVGNNGLGVIGVNPRCWIMPIRMYNGQSTWMTDLVSSIDYAWQNGARVISVSYNIDGFTTALSDAIGRAGTADVAYVNSAGNNAQQDPPRAALRNVHQNILFVASTDRNDARSSFSNYGTNVEIAAPGSDIMSTRPGNLYQLMSGTSMATPHAAGALGFVRSMFPSLTARQALDRMIGTADAKPGLGISGGRLNLSAAVEVDTAIPSDPVNARLDLHSTSAAIVSFDGSGDDGASGMASNYDIRISSNPITLANFNAAQRLTANVPQVTGGQRTTVTLSGFPAGPAYYCAIRAVDNVGNYSSGMTTTMVGMRPVTTLDDVEGAPKFASISGPWAITTTDSNSATQSWTDSPAGAYANNANIELRSNQSWTMAGPAFLKVAMKTSLEAGFDFLMTDISLDNGNTWTQMDRRSGNAGWSSATFYVPATAGQQLRVRFRMTSDGSVTGDGVYIDDITLAPVSVLTAMDTMEPADWTPSGGFATVTDSFVSAPTSWTDSPAGQYANNFTTNLNRNNPLAISGPVIMTFNARVNTESGYDFLRVMAGPAGGTMSEVARYSGSANSWASYQVPVNATGSLNIGFRFTSDGSVQGEGVWVDNVQFLWEPLVDPRRGR